MNVDLLLLADLVTNKEVSDLLTAVTLKLEDFVTIIIVKNGTVGGEHL